MPSYASARAESSLATSHVIQCHMFTFLAELGSDANSSLEGIYTLFSSHHWRVIQPCTMMRLPFQDGNVHGWTRSLFCQCSHGHWILQSIWQPLWSSSSATRTSTSENNQLPIFTQIIWPSKPCNILTGVHKKWLK